MIALAHLMETCPLWTLLGPALALIALCRYGAGRAERQNRSPS